MTSKSGDLPLGWCWATVGDTGKYINGFAFKPEHREAAGRPIVRIQNLTDPEKPLNRTLLAVSEYFHVATGEMLLSWSATVDVFVWNREPALVNQHIFRVVPHERLVEKSFLFHWLKVAIDQLLDSEHLHGSTMKHINRGPFMAHRIPLPPLREQQRIAEALDELLSDLDAGVSELKAAQRKLAQYRQSLLKAAVEGTLTADWRAAHGKPQETGAELLRRILSERRARWEQKQLSKFAEQGNAPPNGWQAKYPEPVAPDLTDMPPLPEGWVWASVEQLADLMSGHTPKDAGQFAQDDGCVHWFKVGDMNAPGNEDLLIKASVRFTHAVASKLGLKVAPAGTIVFPKRGGAIATNKKRKLGVSAAYDLNMMGLVAAPSAAEWLWSWFKGINLAKLSDGSNIPQINNPDIAPLLVPIPPVAELTELIDRLEGALENVIEQEESVAKVLKQAAAQRKNLLKAAFAGQLVLQDPNDEPASELLARIRAERASNDGGMSRRRRKTA